MYARNATIVRPDTSTQVMIFLRSLLLVGSALVCLAISTPSAMCFPTGSSGSAIVLKTEQRPGRVRILNTSDRAFLLRAFQAAERPDWSAARALAAQVHDSIGPHLIEWRYVADKNSGATFEEIAAFLRANTDWPGRDVLFARAEAAMTSNLEPQRILQFFQDHAPVSSWGKVKLGEAYLAGGRTTYGDALIREAWVSGDFTPTQEYQIVSLHGSALTPDVERQRLERLLFNGDAASVQRQLSRAPADAQMLAQVRLALSTSPTQGQRMLYTLSPSQQWDPNLLIDRAKLLAAQNQLGGIPSLLARSSIRTLAQIDPGRVWAQIGAAARLAISDRYYDLAHTILQYSGLTKGEEYGESEFLAGWLDLRFLRHPEEAHAHFLNLAGAVARPISKARALYWAGRASEAARNYSQAKQDYGSASEYPQTFYGQLAMSKLRPSAYLHIPEAAVEASRSDIATYENRDLTHAMHILADLGLVGYLRMFATYDAETRPDPRHLKLLASDLATMGFTDVGVRVAKVGAYSGVHLLPYSHPLLSVPSYVGPGYAPESAFVLAIIRQETEFDPGAVSGAGARGLMQLMPSSAKHDAARGGLQYVPTQLISNPAYNMRLGMIELSENLATYSGSYLLTAAAYNAGRGNVRKWIAAYGDPRSPTVDPLDWIEEIPFAETRNYVQRVLENTEVYRNRISGRDEPLRILPDLFRPKVPDARGLPA